MKRIGVFICHCGQNIAQTVQIDRLKETLERHPRMTVIEDYPYMCSEPGQKLVRDKVLEHGLDAFVVAACSPTLHEATFRRVARDAGLSPYQCEMANIREQCSWVHPDPVQATAKAARLIKSAVQKVRLNRSLAPIRIPVTKRALVIGGGISGIQAALDLANAGQQVILVERSPSIGGHMAQLSVTFPTLDCSQCILAPRMVEISHHPNVRLLTYSEVEDIQGHIGRFQVRIRRKPRYVEEDKCTGCGDCVDVCPSYVPSEFERGLSWRKAIYIPFPQAVPNVYCLDADHCLGLNPLACAKCAEACDPKAINYDMQPEIIEVEVGAVILATGYELYGKEKIAEYGEGEHLDVIDGLQFERLLTPAGPTGGVVRRPSDGKVPKEVVFIQCVGSRDPEQHLPYCSKICCMYTAKHAMFYRNRVPDGTAYIFYMDIRAGGKGYEEFVQRGTEEDGIFYIRGRVARVFREGDKMVVWGADTLAGTKVEIKADLVVLAMAMVPEVGVGDLARKLRAAVDEHGFMSAAHPKLRPVESLTIGVFLAGCAEAPRDIPESVGQASGAAAKAMAVLSVDELEHDPAVVGVEEDRCSGCGMCLSVCPYEARALDVTKKVVKVTEVLCEGCGACAAACPSGAAQQRNLTDEQIFSMIEASLEAVDV